MHKTLSIALVGLFLIAGIPTASAETRSAQYDVPGGASGNEGTAVSTRLCAAEWDEWDEGIFTDGGDTFLFGPAGFTADNNPDDTIGQTVLTPAMSTTCGTGRAAVQRGDDGVVNVGIFDAGIRSDSDAYSEFAVTVTDTLPTSSFFVFCVITQYADGRDGSDQFCGGATDDIEDPRASGCGTVSVSSPVPAGGPLNRPNAFVYATFVDENTGAVCLASKGSLTVLMS